MPGPADCRVMPTQSVSFIVNGRSCTVETHPMRRLLDVLREDLQLTGTKEGCGEGECGACSILVNDELVNSCLIPVAQVNGARICTVEELAKDGLLHAVQQAFIDCGAAQCGICTPGMILASLQLWPGIPLRRNSRFVKAFPEICAAAPATLASSKQCEEPQGAAPHEVLRSRL